MTRDDIRASYARIGINPDYDLELCSFVAPLDRNSNGGEGSTDVGDVSWAVSTVQARVTTCAMGIPFHTWQLTAHGKTGIAHKGLIQTGILNSDMIYPALALAASAVIAAFIGRAIVKKIDLKTFEIGVQVLLGTAGAALLL